MTCRCLPLPVIFLACAVALAGTNAKPNPNPNQTIDRIVEKERALADTMRGYNPMVETYLQRMQPDSALGFVPSEDHYFLGRVEFQQSKEEFYLDKRLIERMAGAFSKLYSLSPVGFSSMIFVDRSGFDRKNYRFR